MTEQVTLQQVQEKYRGTILCDLGTEHIYHCPVNCVETSCADCEFPSTRRFYMRLRANGVRLAQADEFDGPAFVIDTNSNLGLVIPQEKISEFKRLFSDCSEKDNLRVIMDELKELGFQQGSFAMLPGKLLTSVAERTLFLYEAERPEDLLVWVKTRNPCEYDQLSKDYSLLDTLTVEDEGGMPANFRICCLCFTIEENYEAGQLQLL